MTFGRYSHFPSLVKIIEFHANKLPTCKQSLTNTNVAVMLISINCLNKLTNDLCDLWWEVVKQKCLAVNGLLYKHPSLRNVCCIETLLVRSSFHVPLCFTCIHFVSPHHGSDMPRLATKLHQHNQVTQKVFQPNQPRVAQLDTAQLIVLLLEVIQPKSFLTLVF